MQDKERSSVVALEGQITERYGLLLSQSQLAELLGRTTGGLRYSLSYPSDHQTRAIKRCVEDQFGSCMSEPVSIATKVRNN